MELSRAQVLRLRMHRQGLSRRGEPGSADAVLALGIQHAGASVAQALAARVNDIPCDTAGMALAWTYRGAPHLHRDADVPALANALAPISAADAQAKLSWSTPHVQRVGMAADEAIHATAAAARRLVTAPMSKGAASAALTRALPDTLSYECRACRAVHVYEQLMRLAMLPAGIVLDRDAAKVVLRPRDGWTPPGRGDPAPAIRAYLQVLGPATPKRVAGFLGSTAAELEPFWPADLHECTVDGRTAYLAGEPDVPPQTELVRLLPPLDPYLQARDRDLIVPDRAAQKELWRIIGNPGALLVDGEILGTWRQKASGRKLTITVAPFAPLDARVHREVRAEATRLAELRGAATLDVTIG